MENLRLKNINTVGFYFPYTTEERLSFLDDRVKVEAYLNLQKTSFKIIEEFGAFDLTTLGTGDALFELARRIEKGSKSKPAILGFFELIKLYSRKFYKNGNLKSESFVLDSDCVLKFKRTKINDIIWKTKSYYSDGKKSCEIVFQSGLKKAITWKPNGEVCNQSTLKEGNGDIVEYHENNKKRIRTSIENGKIVSVESWMPSGEKCNVSKIENGSGVLVCHGLEGNRKTEIFIKDGEVQIGSLPLRSSTLSITVLRQAFCLKHIGK